MLGWITLVCLGAVMDNPAVPGCWDGSPMGAWVLLWITLGCLGAATVTGVVSAQCKLAGRKGWSKEEMVLEQRDELLAAPPRQFGAVARWVVGFSHRGKLRQR